MVDVYSYLGIRISTAFVDPQLDDLLLKLSVKVY